MKGYQPFPIYDLRSGLQMDAEPWLLAKNAFQEAENVYFYNGRLHKRRGYSAFATGTPLWDAKFNNGKNEPTVADVLDSTSETDGVAYVSVTVDGGTWAGNDASGTVRVAKATAPGFAVGEVLNNVTASNTVGDILSVAHAKGVNQLASGHVMGIYEHYLLAGTSELIVFDKSFLYEYDADNDVFVGQGGFDTDTPDFTGDDDNFFWCEPVGKGQLGASSSDLTIIVNDKDTPVAWDGSTLTDLDATNMPDAALFVVHHKNRLIFLNTTEGGQRYPQRARCTDVGSYNACTKDYTVDADTIDWINGVAFIRGELMVFFERSVWWLRYTGDAQKPFGWIRIAETEGSYAPFSVVNFEDEAIALGPTSWIGCDGISVYPIDSRVPDLILDMNASKTHYAYGLTIDELRQYICSYPGQGKNYPDKILALNYVDDAFSIYDLAMHCAGYWTESSDLTFDDVSETFDELDISFDERTKSAGYPITLMGDVSGYVRKLFDGASDNGSAIASKAKTVRLVPYQNQLAKFGYLDIIGDSGSALEVTVKLYKDYKSTAFLTRTVSMYEAGKDKTIQRVRVMERGQSFEIEISDNATGNTYAIDAIIPYFKPGGNIK